MVCLGSIRAAGKALAQNTPSTGAYGLTLLLNDDDYTLAVRQARAIYEQQRPNVRVVDVTIATAGARLTLRGTGAAAALTGADAFAKTSNLLAVWSPYDATEVGQEANDENSYRIIDEPGGKLVLESLTSSFRVADVARLRFTRPHTLTEAANEVTNPTAAPTVAMNTPAAAGNVDQGLHSWVYVWRTIHGATLPSPAASLTVSAPGTNGKVLITVPASGQYGVVAADVYRTVAGDGGTRKLVGTIGSDGGSLVDNIADSSLGADVPSENTAGGTNTVDEDDEEALNALAASLILQMAANKMAQNTGNTNLPNDLVDRRTQSDIFRSRARDMRELFNTLMGVGKGVEVGPASGFKDLDSEMSDGRQLLWHGSRFT